MNDQPTDAYENRKHWTSKVAYVTGKRIGDAINIGRAAACGALVVVAVALYVIRPKGWTK